MMKQFDSSKKLQDIKVSDFNNIQPYFSDKNVENARIKFKIRIKLLKKITGNFKNRYEKAQNGLKVIFVWKKCHETIAFLVQEERIQKRS